MYIGEEGYSSISTDEGIEVTFSSGRHYLVDNDGNVKYLKGN